MIDKLLKGMDAIKATQLGPSYEDRKIGRTEVEGLIVSTCYTVDEGYETAILDVNQCVVVERYETKEKAQLGHGIWCKKAKTMTEAIELGCNWNKGGDSIKDKVILVRKENKQ